MGQSPVFLPRTVIHPPFSPPSHGSLPVKKRRDADRPPLLASATHHGTESKEKKKPVTGNSKPMEYIYWLVGLVWYGITGLWRQPKEHQLRAQITLTRGIYTKSDLILKVQHTVKSQTGGGGGKAYFRAYRLGIDSVAIDPDQV